jgi:hypothetical protein
MPPDPEDERPAMIDARGLVKRHGATPALDGVDREVPAP